MSATLIQLPTMDEIPEDLRPATRVGQMHFDLPEIDREKLPEVVGFRLLVLPVRPPKQTEGGIALVAESIQNMQIMRTTGMVLRMGPLAFSTQRGWPEGYRDKLNLEGSWVQFMAHAGQDVPVSSADGTEQLALKYLNDADILGVFPDSESISPFTVLI